MTIKRVLLILIAVICTAPVVGAAAVPLYLQIDGRWYETTAGSPVTLSFGTFEASGAQLSACHRADFVTQPTGGIWVFYGPYYDTVRDIQYVQWRGVEDHPASRVIVLRTSDYNVICNQEVVSPETGTYFVDPIFANGFD